MAMVVVLPTPVGPMRQMERHLVPPPLPAARRRAGVEGSGEHLFEFLREPFADDGRVGEAGRRRVRL